MKVEIGLQTAFFAHIVQVSSLVTDMHVRTCPHSRVPVDSLARL